MHVAFVSRKTEKRVLVVDMGENATSVAKMTTEAANFINLLCETLSWQWEPLMKVFPNTKVLSYDKLKEVFHDAESCRYG